MKREDWEKCLKGFCTTHSLVDDSLLDQVKLFEWNPIQIDHFENLDLQQFEKEVLLGRRAEQFFLWWVDQSSRYDRIAQNIQIHNESRRTIGELDMILHDRLLDEVVHVEMVYKFYLFDKTLYKEDESTCWIGPNRRDRLVDKLSKLNQKQFPLLFLPETKERLRELNVPFPDRQELMFLVNYYLPYQESHDVAVIPKGAQRGSWMTYHNFLETYENEDVLLFIPEKNNWFMTDPEDVEWKRLHEVKDILQQRMEVQLSPLVYVKNNQKIEQLFVVWW